MPFENQTTTLIIPEGAGPNDTRIEINGEIPQALRDYYVEPDMEAVIASQIIYITETLYLFDLLLKWDTGDFVQLRGLFDETIPLGIEESITGFFPPDFMGVIVGSPLLFFLDLVCDGTISLEAGNHIDLSPDAFGADVGDVRIVYDGADNTIVGGRVAESIETTNSPDFTSETVIGAVTATLRAGRRYGVRCNASIRGSNAGDLVACRIREDSLSGPQRQRGYVVIGSASEVRSFDVPLYYEFEATTTGSKTFVVTASRISGSGTIGRRAAGDEPQITHLDLIR